jgi:transcriptional regulator with XRE-family HTH domain
MAVNRKPKAKANRVDAHVGRHLRGRRVVMGMGVKKLAKVIDVGHRQIQKYELGIDRIAASDLYRFARFLGVPVSYFFAGLPGGPGAGRWRIGNRRSAPSTARNAGFCAGLLRHRKPKAAAQNL